MSISLKDRAKSAIVSVSGALASYGLMPAHAAVTVSSASISSADSDVLIGNILGIILMVATFIGSALLIWGMVMFGLAIKNDEPESKQKALMTAFAGVILVGIRSILSAAGIITG